MAGKTCIGCGKKTMFKDNQGGYHCSNCNMKVVPAKKPTEEKCVVCDDGVLKYNVCNVCGAKYIKGKKKG